MPIFRNFCIISHIEAEIINLRYIYIYIETYIYSYIDIINTFVVKTFYQMYGNTKKLFEI